MIPDRQRARLLAALPEDARERGIYVFDGDIDEDLSPGSLVAPIVGPLIPDADVVVETGAPPLALLAGIDADADLPKNVVRIDDLVAIGSPADVDHVRDALGDDAEIDDALTLLAASAAPLGWAGPLPGCEPGASLELADGTLVATLSRGEIHLSVVGPAAASLRGVVAERLGSEAPRQSPGKPWRAIFTSFEVDGGDDLTIEAIPADLPGGLLRQFLDTRGLTFLRPAECPP